MYIRRKVFSLLQDETGEERYFSTTDVTLENEEERTFSVAEGLEEKDFSNKKEKVDLKDVKSHKGLKRALAAGLTGLDAGGGLAGGYVGKKAADEADKEGKSDEEILKEARKAGRNVGIGVGAGIGINASAKNLKKIETLVGKKLGKGHKAAAITGAALITGALGGLGGRNAASVNTKDRLSKRALKERKEKED